MLRDKIAHRELVDYSINQLGKVLFGHENGSKILKNVRSPGQPLVDDWDCLKALVNLLTIISIIMHKYQLHLIT